MDLNLDISYLPSQMEVFFEEHPRFLIVTKGRRAGITRGGIQAMIEGALDGDTPQLWVDTINANIDRYYERYAMPVLRKLPRGLATWNQQKRELRIGESVIDFRSADKPDSIEGFGYRKIFLNEAGIILKNAKLWSTTILPMLLDFPDSQLIAAGVPKGRYNKDGSIHKFAELVELAQSGAEGYRLLNYSSYTNPTLSQVDIDDIQVGMSQEEIRQEIYGEIVEDAGGRPFATHYDPQVHEGDVRYDPRKQLIIHMDINIDPMAVGLSHFWRDGSGVHDHQFDELTIQGANVQKLATILKERYPQSIPNCIITGDATGNKRDVGQRDHASFYSQLRQLLGIRTTQLHIPRSNPTHENSRNDVNWVLYHTAQRSSLDFKINPAKCPDTVRDMKNVQVDAYGQLIKRSRQNASERADHLDAVRYKIHVFWRGIIHKARAAKDTQLPSAPARRESLDISPT